MSELKQWNDLYGEGGSRKKQQLSYFLQVVKYMHQEMIVSIIVRERGDNCDRYNLQNRKLHSPESKEEILEPCAKLVSTSESVT